MKKIVAIVIMVTTTFSVHASDYKSDEFNDPNSRVASVYMCAVTGHKRGYEPNAFVILARFNEKSGINIKDEHAANLMHDSFKWYENKKGHFLFAQYWEEQCKIPFSNIKKFIKD